MASALQRIFKVYPDEWRLLIWVTLIQLAMRVSSVLINNYSQTAFLKRFGVEHLPTVFLVEAILTFFVINAVGILMGKFRTLTVFTGLLLFFAASVSAIRVLIPMDIPLLYPALFILKSQAIGTLPILYWDLLNDLFTTRQSKRLFTLITAGGILGTTVGSILTGKVARWVGVDNVLWIFAAGTVLAAILNQGTEWVLGAPIQPRTDRRRGKSKPKLSDTLREARAFSKESPFLPYMVLLVGIPNMVLPILTYQFNVVVDMTYGTEQDTLQFLGLFRGISNAFIFGALLFSGRLVGRWGVPTSLLLHPLNYLLAFLALFLRFDILSAMYARFSTEVFKTTLNNPARAVLYNFFPPRMRAMVRVFLRGTVVRASDLAGSGLLIALKGPIPPQMLSLVAAPLVGVWILTSFLIRRNYPSMLVKVLLERQIDWRRLEQIDLRAVGQDPKSVQALRAGLWDSREEVALLCAEILSMVRPAGWAEWIAEAIQHRPVSLQKGLLGILENAESSKELMDMLAGLATGGDPEILAPLARTMARIDPVAAAPVLRAWMEHPDPALRCQAMVGILEGPDQGARARCLDRIRLLLQSAEEEKVQGALEVLASAGGQSFLEELKGFVRQSSPRTRGLAMRALAKVCDQELLEMALGSIRDPHEEVRRAAAEIMASCGEKVPSRVWITLLGDQDPAVRQVAREVLRDRHDASSELIASLASPYRRLREEALKVLDELEASPADVSHFVEEQIKTAYWLLAVASAIPVSEEAVCAALLRKHLMETSQEIEESVLRVLSVQAGTEGMHVLMRALGSPDRREVEDALEALESFLSPGVRKLLIPLLERIPLEDKLAVGFRRPRLEDPRDLAPKELLRRLLQQEDPVTVTLALYTLEEQGLVESEDPGVNGFLQAENPLVREAAMSILPWAPSAPLGANGKHGLTMAQKAHYLSKVPIFSSVRVRDLLAMAQITQERPCAPREAIVREGEAGDTLYLVVSGEFQVLKNLEGSGPVPLARMGSTEFFGEMALFDRGPRSATVVAVREGLLLSLQGEAFEALMVEHPTIPMAVCVELSRRMRALQEQLKLATAGSGL